MADNTDTPAAPPKPRKPAARKKAPAKPAAAKAPKAAAAKVKAQPVAANHTDKAKSRFSAAIDEAKAGVEALRDEARDRTAGYRAKASDNAKGWAEDAKGYAGQARDAASGYAREGKARTSDALGALGKSIGDTASTIDEKLGVKYGDYARSASRQMQEAAVKLDSKSVEELGEDAREFVRKSPGTALGIAAVAGFFVARMFRGSKD
ncbi:hypothetical protein RXV95_09440 [Novosphingobium sp. ZN18A2]|uniref:hypothetical protein n=1 Tax=Novosphingobium sp. ZN18A2 TaxID=3079861 RepID=UPI0030CCF1FE